MKSRITAGPMTMCLLTAAVALSFFLTGCGGGGGSAPPPPATFGLLELQIFEPQPSNISNATISGNFILGTGTPAGEKVTDLSGFVAFDGVSALTGTLDESTPAADLADQPSKGTYSVTNTPVNGHGTFTITPAGGPPANFVFLLLAEEGCRSNGKRCVPSPPLVAFKVVAIPADATQTNPPVLVLEARF